VNNKSKRGRGGKEETLAGGKYKCGGGGSGKRRKTPVAKSGMGEVNGIVSTNGQKKGKVGKTQPEGTRSDRIRADRRSVRRKTTTNNCKQPLERCHGRQNYSVFENRRYNLNQRIVVRFKNAGRGKALEPAVGKKP